MGQRQSPETQIGGGVGDGTEHVFDGVDGLVDVDFAHGLIVMAMGATTSTLLVSGEACGQRGLAFSQLHVASQLTIVVGLLKKE